MNYNYCGTPFLEITFPTRSVPVALFRYEDIKRIKQTKENDKPIVIIYAKNVTSNDVSEWYFDGTMEEFKNNCRQVFL